MAHALASRTHLGQRNRFGDAVVAHRERVAARVPRDARALAWLHDVVERTDASSAELVHIVPLGIGGRVPKPSSGPVMSRTTW